MTSGELLKYRKGLLIARGYGTSRPNSSRLTLTMPPGRHRFGLKDRLAFGVGLGIGNYINESRERVGT